MKRYFIGIDPGKTGAVAIIEENVDANVFDFGIDGLAALTALSERAAQYDNIKILSVMESIGSFSPAGRSQGAMGMVKYGESAGIAQGWLRALQIPQDVDVRPVQWKKDLRLTVTKPTSTKDVKKDRALMAAWEKSKKEKSFELARRLFPSLALEKLTRQKDHNRAEALLIAEWLMRRFVYKEPQYAKDTKKRGLKNGY